MYFGRPAPGTGIGARGEPQDRPDGALLIVDARHPGLAQDLKAWAWLSTQDLAIGVVAPRLTSCRARNECAMCTHGKHR